MPTSFILLYSLRLSLTWLQFLFGVDAASLALRQSTALASDSLLSGRRLQLVRHPRMPRSPWRFGLGYLLPCSFNSRLYTLVYLRPFAAREAFGSFGSASPGCCPFSFPLMSVTGFHWLKVRHYYGPVCHPAPHLLSLASRLVRAYQFRLDGTGLPQLSLPEHESVRPNFLSYPALGLSHFTQGYPPGEPTSVRLRYVPCSSFGFLQHPPSVGTRPLPATPLPTDCLPAYLDTHVTSGDTNRG